MFEALNQGIYKTVTLPRFGLQDKGISPAGVMDLFSYECGNALLENPVGAQALELIYPPRFKAVQDGCIIITGAGRPLTICSKNGDKRSVPHACVVKVGEGEILEFGTSEYGFRTYLCFRKQNSSAGNTEGQKRGSFEKVSVSWRDPERKIRVVRGPEYGYLNNPDLFLNEGWTIGRDISDMGLRLMCGDNTLDLNMQGNMISEAVSDGTVQLTAKGPIILLKHRQTVGGYPRIFNVISADVDLLAQFGPGQVIHFKEVNMESALQAAKIKNNEIIKLRKRK